MVLNYRYTRNLKKKKVHLGVFQAVRLKQKQTVNSTRESFDDVCIWLWETVDFNIWSFGNISPTHCKIKWSINSCILCVYIWISSQTATDKMLIFVFFFFHRALETSCGSVRLWTQHCLLFFALSVRGGDWGVQRCPLNLCFPKQSLDSGGGGVRSWEAVRGRV